MLTKLAYRNTSRNDSRDEMKIVKRSKRIDLRRYLPPDLWHSVLSEPGSELRLQRGRDEDSQDERDRNWGHSDVDIGYNYYYWCMIIHPRPPRCRRVYGNGGRQSPTCVGPASEGLSIPSPKIKTLRNDAPQPQAVHPPGLYRLLEMTRHSEMTVNSEWYTTICLPEVFEEIRKNNRQRRIILHHANASCHTSAETRFLEGQKIELTGHPPHNLIWRAEGLKPQKLPAVTTTAVTSAGQRPGPTS
ncbi:hypothetical protein EVAR_96414_1 [Eumeta japonica]|uniref:Mariner Mos1 transposase n=1 Tax=Eumeta variegata TaxID=151549 RepID=A0A4C1WAF9_EUMVA|nr:hypothetical protein EVAR_96414_1 [Eumeta japonica]